MIVWFRTRFDEWLAKRFAEPVPARPFDDLYILPQSELEKRAKASDGTAACVLGDMHDKGQVGEAADFQEALRWYRRAEKLGNGDALNNLGSMHQHGELLERDLVKAADYYERAGKAGCAVGWGNLGRLYLDGNGVPRNLRKARKFLWRAVRGGDGNGTLTLGHAYDVGAFSPAPLRALYCYRKATTYNQAGAFINLASLYRAGQGVRQDDKKALALSREAAELGSATGAYYIGRAYRDGRGVDVDMRLALGAFMVAADRGDESAAHFRDELLAESPSLAADLGDRLRRSGNHDEAILAYRRAMPHLKTLQDEAGRRRLLHAKAGFAACLHNTGRFEEARLINAGILPLIEAKDGEAYEGARVVRNNLADNLLELGDLPSAIELAKRTVMFSELGGKQEELYDDLNRLAILCFQHKLFQDADALLRRRIDIAIAIGDADLIEVAREQHAGMLQMSLSNDGIVKPM